MLVTLAPNVVSIPCAVKPADLPVAVLSLQYLGSLDGTPCFAGEIDRTSVIPENLSLQGLRGLYGSLREDLFVIAGMALQITDWDITHQFCSKCGERLVQEKNRRAKSCRKCNLEFYPRLAPAVIVAVTRDDSILLAHAGRFPSKMYSVLAGFVEPRESLEQCVVREVKEEVNIEIKNLKYFGSQSWPFTNSLMIAFTAEYAGGRIQTDGDEITDAGWYKASDLPDIPGKISVARKLIDWFVEQHLPAAPKSNL